MAYVHKKHGILVFSEQRICEGSSTLKRHRIALSKSSGSAFLRLLPGLLSVL